MYQLSKASLKKLTTCRTELILLMTTAIVSSPIDFSIVYGHRGEKEQNDAYKQGFSKLKYPQSKHNKIPSMAVDVIPYPNGYNATNEEWSLLINHIKEVAKKLNIKINCGYDWGWDNPHIELSK